MKLICNYENLTTALQKLTVVVEDSLSAEEMKNVIFRIDKETKGIQLIGFNQLIVYKVRLEPMTNSVEVEDDEFGDRTYLDIQVKSKALNNFLNTFKSMRRTKVNNVVIESCGIKLAVVVEEAETESDRVYYPKCMFDNIPIKQTVMALIDVKVPEETTILSDVNKILLPIDSLLPVMGNDNTLYSKMIFSDGYVYAIHKAFSVVMKDMFNEGETAFKEVYLMARVLQFMKVFLNTDVMVQVGKNASYIVLLTDDSEAFVRYDSNIPRVEQYRNLIDKSHYVCVDRLYFKDVLKRLSLENENINVEISAEDSIITVSNKKFTQDIYIEETKDMDSLGKINFKIMPAILTSCIIGDDAIFGEKLRIYISPQDKGGYKLTISDESDAWFVSTVIR